MIRRWTHLLIFSAALASQTPHAQGDVSDPAFDAIPFDQWISERGGSAPFRWAVAADRPELTFHQRLLTSITVTVDGRDLEPRRGKGELVFFVQITGPGGSRSRRHGTVKLADLDPNIKAADLEYRQLAFVTPGEFRFAVAILDTATGEHAARTSQFRVPPPQRKQLTEAWRGLPEVEFIASENPPESWFLPEVEGRIRWADVTSDASVRLNVLMNIAPPPPDGRSRRTTAGAMSALLPALKLLSSGSPAGVSEHVEVIDIARRRAALRRDGGKELDWQQLKESLDDSNTASIDVGSLSERHREAQFFVSEVSKAIRASAKGCVVVVLTAPVSFEGKEDLQPISLEDLPACRVAYVRFHVLARPMFGAGPMGVGRRGMGPPRRGPAIRMPAVAFDELAGTLKPLKPKIFDVSTPDEFTRVLEEVQRMLRGD